MGDYTPQSRTEEILLDTIRGLPYTEQPQSRVEALLLELKEVIEGGSGTTDYEDLENKPSINNVELSGDKSLADLGAASEEAVAAKASQSDIAPAFSDATDYTVGDVVYYDGSLYRFTADHSAGAWDSADVESVTVDDLVDGLKPVDSITDGDMRPVTSNSVYDALVSKADLPVDAVTNGESKAVTSNAVYDFTNEYVEVSANGTETYKQLLNRLYALVDLTKVGASSHVAFTGDGNVYYPSSYTGSLIFTFTKNNLSTDIANSTIIFYKILISSNSSYMYHVKLNFNSSGVPTGAFKDYSNDTATGIVRFFYR